MQSDDFTDLVLEIFRLNGALIAAGDTLVADLGLTSARWQVLGAVATQPTPAPVAQLARSLGLARQSVQRVVDELVNQGVLAFLDNPGHRRAKLVRLTTAGEKLYAAASDKQRPWAEAAGAAVSAAALAAATRTLAKLRAHLETRG